MDGPPGTADLAPAWAAALVERLAAVENELRATRETVERLSERLTPEPKITRADRAVLAKMLPALYARFGDAAFMAADVAADTTVSPIRPGSTKSLGKFFSRVVGIRIGLLEVAIVGAESRTRLWKISSCAVLGVSRGLTAA